MRLGIGYGRCLSVPSKGNADEGTKIMTAYEPIVVEWDDASVVHHVTDGSTIRSDSALPKTHGPISGYSVGATTTCGRYTYGVSTTVKPTDLRHLVTCQGCRAATIAPEQRPERTKVKVEHRRNHAGYVYRTDTYWSDGGRTSTYPNYEL